MTSQTTEHRGIPDHAKKAGPKMVQYRPLQPGETSAKGFRMPDGTFVQVPRTLRKAIASMFEAANKTNVHPAQLRGVLNYALDTAIAQGAQMAKLMEEQMAQQMKQVEFADDSDDICGWEIGYEADTGKPEMYGVSKDCPPDQIDADHFFENRDDAVKHLEEETAKWEQAQNDTAPIEACDDNG